MRSNSGKDEGRNNLHDPTMRDRELGRGLAGKKKPGTTEMGSASRKQGQEGDKGAR